MRRKKYIVVRKRIKKKHHHHRKSDATKDHDKSPILDPPPLPIPDIQPLKELVQNENSPQSQSNSPVHNESSGITEVDIPTSFIHSKRKIRHRGTRTLDPDEMSQGSRNINYLFDIEINHNVDDDKFSTTPQPSLSFFKSNSREIFNLEDISMPHRSSNESISGILESPILDITDDIKIPSEIDSQSTVSEKETETSKDENSEKKKHKKKKIIFVKKKKKKVRTEVARTLDESDFKPIIVPQKKKGKKKKAKRPVTIDPEEISSPSKKLIPDKNPAKGIDIMCVILDYPSPEELAPFQMPERPKPVKKDPPKKILETPKKENPLAIAPQTVAGPHVHFDFNDVPVKVPPIRRKHRLF